MLCLSQWQVEKLGVLIFLRSSVQIALRLRGLGKGSRFVYPGPNFWRLRQVGSENTAEIGPSMTVAVGMVEAWVAKGEKTFLRC